MFLKKENSPQPDSYDMLVSSFVSILVLVPAAFFIFVVFKKHPPYLDWILYGSVGITLLASVISVSKSSRRWAIIAFSGAILPYISLLLLMFGFFILALTVSGMHG